MTEPRHRRPVAFLRQLVLLAVCGLLVPAQLYLAIPLATPVQVSFAASESAAAWTGSAFSLAYAIGFLVFGPLSDRIGRRRSITDPTKN
jgi:YNFM family putative membrane transporter